MENAPELAENKIAEAPAPPPPYKPLFQSPNENKFGIREKYGGHEKNRYERGERRPPKHEDKKKHLTEAEKSVMHLHKYERMEREKRDKYRRENPDLGTRRACATKKKPFTSSFVSSLAAVDDFASTIEKAIAKELNKDKTQSEEERDETKRGKKRKKKEKERRKVSVF